MAGTPASAAPEVIASWWWQCSRWSVSSASSRRVAAPDDAAGTVAVRSRMRIALAAGFTFMVGWYGNVFLISLYLQQHLGLTPSTPGWCSCRPPFFSIVGNLAAASLTNRFGARFPVVAGLLSMVVGLTALVLTGPPRARRADRRAGRPDRRRRLLAMPSVTGVVLEASQRSQAGTASAVFNTFRQVGGAVAIAVFGALIADPGHLDRASELSLGIAAACLLVTGLSFLALHTPHGTH